MVLGEGLAQRCSGKLKKGTFWRGGMRVAEFITAFEMKCEIFFGERDKPSCSCSPGFWGRWPDCKFPVRELLHKFSFERNYNDKNIGEPVLTMNPSLNFIKIIIY